MEKTAKDTGTIEPGSVAELFGIMQNRIQEQDEKIGRLLEIANNQNIALRACKSRDGDHARWVSLADECLHELRAMLSAQQQDTPEKKADKAA